MAKRRISGHRSVLLLAAPALALVLALAACSRQNEADQPDDAAPGDQPAGTNPAEATPSAAPSATGEAHSTGAIPQALRGRWGLVADDCTSDHGDAKGLMEVGARTLTFYESRATLKTIRAAEPARLRATYVLSGEGQEWTQDIELRTWNDGAQLIRQDRCPDALPGPLTYTRCAG